MSGQKFFRSPFAATGDREAVPDTVQGDGSMSYPEGFGIDYERNPASDPAAKRIPREKTNGYLFDVTDNLRQYQTAGFPEWIEPSQNGGVAFAYPLNAYCRWNGGAGTDWAVYCAIVDGASLEPGVAAGWEAEWAVSAPVDPADLKASQDETNQGTGAKLVGAAENVKAAREGRWTYAGVGAWVGAQLNVAFTGDAPFLQVAGANVKFSVPSNSPANPSLKVGANVALPIKNYDGTDLAAGDLVAGVVYHADVHAGGNQWRLNALTPSLLSKYSAAGDGSIFGYIVSNTLGALTTHLTFSAGACRDSTNQRNIPRPAPITKALNAVWAAGSGNGGRDQATAPAANETWHAFAILNDATQATDVLFSKSVAAPTLPAGYTHFRRIFSFRLDASANLVEFMHYGDWVMLKRINNTVSGVTNGDITGTYRASGAPVGLKLLVKFVYLTTRVGGNAANPAFSGIYDPDVGVAISSGGTNLLWAQIRVVWNDVNERFKNVVTDQWCDVQGRVLTASNDTGDTITMGIIGYMDQRGRFF